MKIFTCFLLLALVAAVSCTACHKKVHRRHDTCLAPKKSHYFSPKHSSKKSLNVLGFFCKGLHHKLKVSIGIFKFYSTSVISKSVDKSVAAIVNLSRAYGLIINEWVDGLGTIFSKIVMAISRIVFCVLGNPWEGKTYFDRFFSHKSCRTPAICGHKFGVRYGWPVYTGEYTSYGNVLEFYGLKGLDIDEYIKQHIGVGISGLKGNKLIIARAIVSLYGILQRDINVWKRDDIILASRYMITVAASVSAGYHVSAKVDVVDGFIAFINVGFKNNGFPDISKYRADILKDLEDCNSESFNGAIVPYDQDGNDSANGGGHGGSGGNNGGNGGNNGGNGGNNGDDDGNNGDNDENNGDNGGNNEDNSGNGGNSGGNSSGSSTASSSANSSSTTSDTTSQSESNATSNASTTNGNKNDQSNTHDDNNGSNTGKGTKKVVKKVTTVNSDDEESSSQSAAAAAAASQSSSDSNGTQSSSSAAASSSQSESASKKTTTVTEIDYYDYETYDLDANNSTQV